MKLSVFAIEAMLSIRLSIFVILPDYDTVITKSFFCFDA